MSTNIWTRKLLINRNALIRTIGYGNRFGIVKHYNKVCTGGANRLSSSSPISSSNNTNCIGRAERPRRSLFSVPGHVPKMIQKAQTLGADAIVLDLEDGVPLAQKDTARQLIRSALMADSSTNFQRSEVCIRINALDTGIRAIQDIETLLQCPKLQCIVLPKVETASDIAFVSQMIRSFVPDNCNRDVRILAAIESAVGILNLREIAESVRTGACPELDGLIFASEDYCADIEAVRTAPATELLFARSQLVITAKAYGLQAIDMVHINFRDIEALKVECQSGREFGFTGKQAIHPSQIEPIHTAFTPATKDIVFASKCIEQFTGQPIEIDGIVVDTPVYKWALKLLRRAEAAGLLSTTGEK